MGVAALAAAPVFDALGDPNRLRIVIWLCEHGPCSTSTVTQAIPATRQAAAKHLLQLESARLVTSDKQGRERIWTLEPTALTAARDYLSALSLQWDRRINRLRTSVED